MPKRARRCRSTSPSSWTATAAGRSSTACRASRDTGVGADSAREIIRTAGELGIKYLTLYAFSAENWNRPKDEVDALMKYLVHYLKTETKDLDKNNVRLEVIGQIYRLPENVQEHLRKSIATLSKNNGLTLVMALSYGSRIEIVEAVRTIAEKVKREKLETGGHHRESHF